MKVEELSAAEREQFRMSMSTRSGRDRLDFFRQWAVSYGITDLKELFRLRALWRPQKE